MRYYLFKSFLLIQFLFISQEKVENFNIIENILVQSHSEESGMKYISKILEDTNNVVIWVGVTTYSSKGIYLGLNHLFGWEMPQCGYLNDMVKSFYASERFFEFPIINWYYLLDTYSVQKFDSTAFKQISQKFNTSFAKEELLKLSAQEKIEFVQDIQKNFYLSEIESFLLVCSLNNIWPEAIDYNKFFYKKNIFYFRMIEDISAAEVQNIIINI